MKKSVLYFVTTILFVFMTGFSFGQCTPDANVVDPDGSGRMDPDTLHFNSGEMTNISVTVICPTTGAVPGYGSVPIHHITVKSLQNAPAWLTYACNPSDCAFNAGVKNCVLVSATTAVPSGDDTTYIDVLVDVFINLGTPVLALTDYNSGMQIVLIRHPESTGIKETANNTFGIIEPQPNPFNSTTQLGCFTEKPQTVSLRVYNMVGSEVYSEDLNTNAGENYFSFTGSNLNDGVYFYSVTDENKRVITEKFIKSR